MKSALKIENLYYKNILENINLTLDENNIYALVGESGSGKTILLKCIFGLLEYNGIINSKYHINNIGFYDNQQKFISDDVFTILMSPLINLGKSKNEAKKSAFDICKKLDIEDLIYKKVSELSYVNKKMILFAKTVISNPNLIILDNLFDGLDKKNKNKIITYLKKLKNKTIIFTSNNSDDILLSSKIIILNKGTVVYCDETSKILSDDKKLTKNNMGLPFIVELSQKLKIYELIDHLILDKKEMVDAIWK